MQINDPEFVMTNFDSVSRQALTGVRAMVNRNPETHVAANAAPFLNWGQERNEAAMAMQKAVLVSFEKASHAWAERAQSEVALWSEMAAKMTASHSIPEALETYATCVSKRMQMAADDGRRLTEDTQKLTETIMKSFGSGWPTAST